MAKWQKALPAVRRAIVKAGVSFADVDDLVQNAFIKAWSDPTTRHLSLRDGFRARCRTIAFNAAVDHQRRFGREVLHDEIEAASAVNIEHEVEQRERARFINKVVCGELPDKQREAVLHRDHLSNDPMVRKSQIASLARARSFLGKRLKDFAVVPFLACTGERSLARNVAPVAFAASATTAALVALTLLPESHTTTSRAQTVVPHASDARQFPERPLGRRLDQIVGSGVGGSPVTRTVEAAPGVSDAPVPRAREATRRDLVASPQENAPDPLIHVVLGDKLELQIPRLASFLPSPNRS